MQKLEKSEDTEACSWRTLERVRWGLAKRRAVGPGEACELRKTETMGDLGNVHHIGVCIPERGVYFPQTAQQYIPDWAHAEGFGAARTKRPFAYPDPLAEF